MSRRIGSIALVAVGKLHESHWQAAQVDYLARIRRYINLELREVKDAVGDRGPATTAIFREGEALLSRSEDAHCRIVLTPQGKSFDSPRLAEFMQKQIDTYQRLAFLLGGPLGVSPEVLEASDHQLSLSAMTFPHELARVVLLEQLYRAFTILSGEKYHK